MSDRVERGATRRRGREAPVGLRACCGTLLLAALLAIPAGAVAQDRSGQFEIGGGAGLYRFDTNRGGDSGRLLGIGGGYYFSNAWAAELMLLDPGAEDAERSFDLDSVQYRIDGLYHFGSLSRWLPYVAAGIGNARLDSVISGSDEGETLLNLGGGVKYLIDDNLTLRGDLRALRDEAGDQDLAAMFGLSVRLGRNRTSIRDSDGDGVADVDDRCAWTEAAATVDAWGCSQAQADEVDPFRLRP